MKINLALTLFIPFAIASAQSTAPTGWKLVWSDEFNGSANAAPDSTKWTYDLGAGGWGNGEQETYTNSTQNAYQDGQGHLVVSVLNSNGAYTSARLKTQGLYSFTYGKAVARIKIPYAQGIWPAFWTLGSDIATVPWPGCGEIDIMENFGVKNNDASVNHGTLHGPGYSGTGLTASYTLPNGRNLSDDFHLYQMEWAPGTVKLSVDGNLYSTVTTSNVPSGGSWVFDNNPLFFILNVAVGSASTPAPVGAPTGTSFPQQMLVDYVRVYQQAPIASATTPNVAPGGVVNAASSADVVAPGSLAAVYGANLADATYDSLFDSTTGSFVTSTSSGVTASVNGVNAPLVYVSAGQINLQIPWETPVDPSGVSTLTVNTSAGASFAEPITIATASPSVFENYTTNVGLINCNGNPITAGSVCTFYGNGFGPKGGASVDGTPASAASLTAIEVPGTAPCQLIINNQPAAVDYCGAAPYLVIDQINFVYPSGLTVNGPSVVASLTIDGQTGWFNVPAPAQ